MNTVITIADVRSALAGPRHAGRRIGLVPTMGAFHAGHLALMRRARADCDVVVVSLFINPSQFNEASDLAAYPRDLDRDRKLAQDAGVDLLFTPSAEEMYPPGFATTVTVAGVTEPLEGERRGREHFDGVATVVAKLLNIVGPDVAYFGQKDAQQAAMIRRLVADLDLPTRIEVVATEREADGLALSSRNIRLSKEERERAAALHRALQAIAAAIRDRSADLTSALAGGHAELDAAGIEPEYLALVDPNDFTPARSTGSDVLAVVAARVGDARLIDNELITPNGGRP